MRIAMVLVGTLLSLTGTDAVLAQTAPCSGYAQAIDFALKRISDIRFGESMLDNSVPRATIRELQVANYLRMIRLNMLLADKQSCALSADPITGTEYVSNVLECVKAKNNMPASPKQTAPACDLKTWRRDYKPAE